IHPHSVISGTVYVALPPGASALKIEDPRLPLMMAAPPRQADAPEAERSFVYLTPQPGTILMWESWLRHEVPANRARTPRISVSFNYGWR
ncbi:MAG: 2OG-Fe(II) oxygenase family protein, partial [Caulobacteraceae bacterium]|nr:2OG-Fe(II) oxygenase family protein [Caulobacteraceae bacterium]